MSQPASQREMAAPAAESGVCALCAQERRLVNGHIVPAFLFRWMKRTSPAGRLQASEEVGLRYQDGVKRCWFCVDCEAVFGEAEREFAKQIFHPLCNERSERFDYGPWLARFCVSVCWKLLLFRSRDRGFDEFPPAVQRGCDSAMAGWRSFLLGDADHPGAHRVHILLLHRPGLVEGLEYPNNLHRYLLRALDPTLPFTKKGAFVCLKIPRMVILGEVQTGNKTLPRASRVRVRRGVVGGVDQRIPGFLQLYLYDRAIAYGERHDSVSTARKAKVSKAVEADPDRWRNSDAYAALEADRIAFGGGQGQEG